MSGMCQALQVGAEYIGMNKNNVFCIQLHLVSCYYIQISKIEAIFQTFRELVENECGCSQKVSKELVSVLSYSEVYMEQKLGEQFQQILNEFGLCKTRKYLLVRAIDGGRFVFVKLKCWQAPVGEVLLLSSIKLFVGWRLALESETSEDGDYSRFTLGGVHLEGQVTLGR